MMKTVVTCCFWHYVCIKLQNKNKTAHSDLTHLFKVKVILLFFFNLLTSKLILPSGSLSAAISK